MKTVAIPPVSSLQRCNAAVTASFEWNGLHIRDLTAPFGSRSSFAVIDVVPMAKHPLCSSSRCEKYYYLLAGQLLFHCGKADVVLTRQDFLIIPPKTEFAYANRSNRMAQLLLVHVVHAKIDAHALDVRRFSAAPAGPLLVRLRSQRRLDAFDGMPGQIDLHVLPREPHAQHAPLVK